MSAEPIRKNDDFIDRIADAVAARLQYNASGDVPKKAPPKYLTTTQLAEMLGKTQGAVLMMIKRGTIPKAIVKKLGRSYYVLRADFERFMAHQHRD